VDEREAIARLQQHDIGGLEILVRLYQTEATRIAQLITRDRALAEDVVQSAFVRVYERIEQFDPDRPFAPWFYRIVSNDSVRAAQQTSRQVSPEIAHLDQVLDDALSPEEIVATLEQFESVTEALRLLPPNQRAVIVLRYFAGLTDREVADQMESAPGTVRWRLHAARKRLRQILRQPDLPSIHAASNPPKERKG
jgi:RNA polymerase sigma-70 factor (ECF subfamily)